MRLQPPAIAVLLKVIEDSFDPFGLDRLLETRFGIKLHNITSLLKNFDHQAVDVHRYFDQRNRTEELVAVLRDARPMAVGLVTLADNAGFAQVPSQTSLEVLVRKEGQPFQDVLVFRAELAKREAAVCRVETANGYGTGTLVGPNLVLTNHHVVSDVLDPAGNLISAISCLFDHKQSVGGYTTPGLRVEVTDVLAFSPYAVEDLQPQLVNSALDKLDYALLKIERNIADTPVIQGGDNRGFISLGAASRTIGLSEGLLILQHPLAKPMKIDIGAAVWTGATRVRHSVNTEAGSSGAPVFDAGLDLVAVHHAGYDWPATDYPYNQAIPLALIAADARARGVHL